MSEDAPREDPEEAVLEVASEMTVEKRQKLGAAERERWQRDADERQQARGRARALADAKRAAASFKIPSGEIGYNEIAGVEARANRKTA